MAPSQRSTRRPHPHHCIVELLESRIALAVTVSLTGIAPNLAAVFTDDASGRTDNTLEIQVNAALELEFSLNGAPFTNDLDPATGGVQSAGLLGNLFTISANLGTGNDTFVINSLSGAGAFGLKGGLNANTRTMTVNGIVNIGGDIALAVDALDVQQSVNVNGHRVTIEPATAGRPVNLGGEIAGQLSITGTEINRISAGIIQIGGHTSGDLAVSAPIQPIGTDALALVSGAGITETGSIFTGNLRVESVNTVTLNGANIVAQFAANVSGSAGNFSFNDSNPFPFRFITIGTVDGLSGVHVSNATSANLISLTSSQLTVQEPGATITGPSLELKGAAFSLTQTGNNVAILATNLPANVALAYTDVDALTAGKAGATFGIHAGSVTLATVDGDLVVSQTGGGIVAGNLLDVLNLTAGSAAGQHRLFRIESGAFVSAPNIGNTATFTADNMDIAGTIRLPTAIATGGFNLGPATVTLQPFNSSFAIDLGGADAANTLGLSAAEISAISTNMLHIGGSKARTIQISVPIAPSATALWLTTGAGVAPGGVAIGGAGIVSVDQLRLDVAAGSVVLDHQNHVKDVAATVSNGDLTFTDVMSLNIGPVAGLAVTSFRGPATIASFGLTQTAPLVQTGTGTITINSSRVSLDNAANDFTGAVLLPVSSSATFADANDLMLSAPNFGTLTVKAPGTVTMAGPLSGNVLTFNGPGTMILPQGNMFLGKTIVTSGTLLVNGSLTGEFVFVKLGAKLGGTGTIKAIVQVMHDGTLAPGTGTGVLNIGPASFSGTPVQFAAGSTFAVELNGTTPGTGHDQLIVTGSVDLGGTTLAASLGYARGPDDHLVVISNDGVDPVVGTFAGLAEGATLAIGGVNFTITYRGGDGNDVEIRHVGPVQPVIVSGGKVAIYIDTDGDRVTITTTRGRFADESFRAVAMGKGAQLQLIDLHQGDRNFGGADITIVARPTAAGGDGRVDVGRLDAMGIDLGAVRIPGDLGRIDAGDTGASGLAVERLRVESLGMRGVATQSLNGNLSSHIAGRLGTLSVLSDVRGARISADKTIGLVEIGGSFVESTLLSTDGNVGAFRVGGSFVGGRLSAGAAIGSIDVDGDILGTASSAAVISAVGQAIAPTRGTDLAIGRLKVGGTVGVLPVVPFIGDLRVLAGYDAAGVPRNADASIGKILVGGYWRGSTALAGVGAGPDGFEGTPDDVVLSGARVRDNPDIVSQIHRIAIGTAVAGSDGAGDNFGIVAERILRGRIGATILPFTPGAHDPGDFFPGGATGPGPTGLLKDFVICEVRG